MKKQLQEVIAALRRPAYFLASLGIIFGATSGVVLAAASGGQVQFRSVKLSDNGVSGGAITSGVGSGVGVTYRASFTAASSYTLKGAVLDFCAGAGGTPFIGDSACAAPTSFSVGSTPPVDVTTYTDGSSGTPVVYNASSALGANTDWTTGSLNSNQTFYMTNSTGVSITAGQKYSFAISGVTNPSTLGTFYARLITFTTTTDASGYTHGFTSAYQDYGGFALSTAQIVQVTAKVQETLTFCVSGYSALAFGANPATAPGNPPTDCGDTTAPAITLGHDTNNTLDTSRVDTNDIWTIASSNALNGVTIRMHSSNACGGLSTDNGVTCLIPPVNGGAGTLTSGSSGITAGTAAFGMHCYNSSGGTSSTSPMTCDPNYTTASSPALDYGMDNSTVGDNVTTVYGDQIASSTAPVNAVTNQYKFAATASNTTPAGIYTANLAMIATGTF